jgi:hypothetical protein
MWIYMKQLMCDLQSCFAVEVYAWILLFISVATAEQQIVLVTPVWNDSARLELFGPQLARALVGSGLSVHWIVADDGSSALEKAKVAALVECLKAIYPAIEGMFFAERTRKGGAVYQAWNRCSGADLLAFVDADGAIDAASLIHLLRHACKCDPQAVVVGIRNDIEQVSVPRPWMRALSFRLFRTLVHGLVGMDLEDTQCGAKVVPAVAYRAVAAELVERGFVFDVELLLALQRYGAEIKELPIPWREIPAGKVKPLRDAWGMVAGLLRIRKRLQAGRYRKD